jgi:hypothetical protein
MNTSISINTALCLPASDIVALSKGRMIAALSKTFVNSTQQFALCPADAPNSSFTTPINLWARLEFCKIYNDSEDIERLAQLTIWPNENLQKVLQDNHKLFLLCLRVFETLKTTEFHLRGISASKIGSFIKLPNYLFIGQTTPILTDELFDRRKQQLLNLELPLYPELEELQENIYKLVRNTEEARSLDEIIQVFLGWKNISETKSSKQEFDWIYTIDALGRRSKKLDEGKNNYQAGTDFEIVVRQGLEFLGFTIEQAYKGGAGGLDLFCSKPYPLVGECKAGKKIPSDTTEQLIKLGGMHLDTNQFHESTKLIIGPGDPTQDLLTAATKWKVSIINPMSLQKLVELQSNYPGSIDLIELKNYLEPGQIDYKIDEYVERVLGRIKLRSHIVKSIKNHLSQVKEADASIDILFGAYCGSNPPEVVTQKSFHEILIELSSPLAGYLGRIQGTNLQSDRFYYLRDLIVE